MKEVVKGKEGDKGVGSVSVASQFRKRTVVNVLAASKHHFLNVPANTVKN